MNCPVELSPANVLFHNRSFACKFCVFLLFTFSPLKNHNKILLYLAPYRSLELFLTRSVFEFFSKKSQVKFKATNYIPFGRWVTFNFTQETRFMILREKSAATDYGQSVVKSCDFSLSLFEITKIGFCSLQLHCL